MVLLLKDGISPKQLDGLTTWLRELGVEPHVVVGKQQTIIGLIGPEDGGDSDGSKKKKLMDETIYNFERNKTDQTEKMRLTFRIRIRDYKLCQILADSRGISASHVVRMALSEYFQRQDIENEICAKLQRNSTAE